MQLFYYSFSISSLDRLVYLIIVYVLSVCINTIFLVASASSKGVRISDLEFTIYFTILFPGVNTLYSIIILLILGVYLTFELIKFILLCAFRMIKFLILKILNKIRKN